MHYLTIFTALVAATAAAANPTGLEKRTTYSDLYNYHSDDCSGEYDWLKVIKKDVVGSCLTLAGYKSAKVHELHSGCTLTLYTDQYCTDHATAARKGKCVSGHTWKSYSVDC